MSLLPPRGYQRILVIAAYVLVAAVLLYISLRFLLLPFLPFLCAWVIAMLLRPTVDRISRRTRLSRKLVAFFAVSFVFVLVFGLFGIIGGRVLGELRELSETLMSDAAGTVGDFFDSLDELSNRFPFLDRIEDPETAEQIENAVINMIENAITSFSARIPEALLSFIASLPGFLLFAMALIASTFYMGADVGTINARLAAFLPESSRHYLFEGKAKLMSAGAKYVKAYLMILFITFLQLLIGFFCLHIPYALTLAALIALIDILPVLGVGTVLIPWAAVLLIRGDTYIGFGLLLIFAVIWIVRQVIEPKIVGQSIGLPPLLTLIAMYAGYRFLGFIGLFLFPLLLIFLKNLADIGILSLPSSDSKPKNPHL